MKLTPLKYFFTILLLLSLVASYSAFAKSVQEVAKDMIYINQMAETYYQKYRKWPKNIDELDDEDLIDDIDVSREFKNKDYQLFQSQNRFATGVIQGLVKKDDLDLYIADIVSFAGYNWLFIESEIDLTTNKKDKDVGEVDYYEQILPFLSNTKLIIKGTIFNPTN